LSVNPRPLVKHRQASVVLLPQIEGQNNDVVIEVAGLIALGYVARRHPLTEQVSPRQVRFVVEDPLLRFWLRFVYPNPSNATLQGRVFCQRPPGKRAGQAIHRWHTLDDIYAVSAADGT
jgi:AAA+ ATPase superfamily predicted ATPase